MQVDTKRAELTAIRQRLTDRRRCLQGGGRLDPYSTTDLADAEWLLVELERASGAEGPIMTPSEQSEYDRLTRKRNGLDAAESDVLLRLQGKHGELTPEDLVKLDYLTHKQDELLSHDELKAYRRLDELHAQMVGEPAKEATKPVQPNVESSDEAHEKSSGGPKDSHFPPEEEKGGKGKKK